MRKHHRQPGSLIRFQKEIFESVSAYQSGAANISFAPFKLAGKPYLVKMSQLHGVHLLPENIAPLPTKRPEIMGVATAGGQMYTIVDLLSLLQNSKSAAGKGSPWLLTVSEKIIQGIGFKVEGFLSGITDSHIVDSIPLNLPSPWLVTEHVVEEDGIRTSWQEIDLQKLIQAKT